MKVEDVMTEDVQFCTPETNLAAAAMQMWDHDCGTLPVVSEDGTVIGMITDRDICIAAATRHRDIAEIRVGELSSGELHSCAPSTRLDEALKTFQRARVRRLPVLNDDGKLEGILSLNDIVLLSREEFDKKVPDVSYADVVNTFRAISAHHSKAAAAGA
jgi:CBS domain-containing protein